MEAGKNYWIENEVFKENCPAFYKRIAEKFQTEHLLLGQNNSSMNMETSSVQDDAIDNVTAILGVKDCNNSLYILADANFNKDKAVILSGVEIVDETTGTVLASAYQDAYDANDLYVELLQKVNNIRSLILPDGRLRADVHFTWSDNSGKVETAQHSYALDESIFQDIVNELKVNEPRAKDGKETVILYARTPYSGETPDFVYPDNAAHNQLVRVQIPVDGSVTFDSEWEIEEIIFKEPDSKEQRTKLLLFLEGGGQVEYNNGDYENTTLFTVDKEKGEISFHTDHGMINGNSRKGDADSWNVDLDISRFKVKTTVRIVLNLVVRVRKKDNHLIHNDITLVVNSSGLEKQETTMTIEPINIRWGCVKRGTMVLMADGQEKTIESIKPGEMVQNGDGSPKKVCDVYKGMDEELIAIKTEQGSRLQVTADHPVLTEEGWKTARSLCAADRIRIYPEGVASIEELYVVKENAQVYNLQLEGGDASFIGDSIITGTFDMQNQMIAEKDNDLSKEARRLQEEIKNFMESMGK